MRFFSKSAVTLAPLLPLISATIIELSVSDSNSYEIGSQVELECSYHFVSHDGSKINQEEHEVTWFRDNTPIATASSLEDYQIFGYRNGIYGVSPNHNLEFSHEKNYENINSTEIISYTSKLTAANVEIANSGEYQCYVRLLKTQQILSDNPESRKYVFNAASSKISVFNKPSVSVVLAGESFDLRPLELAGTLGEKFDVATCSIADAYPQPKLYEIVIGNRPIIEISADDVSSVSVIQNDETQLFDATIHISQQLFPTDNNAQIICIASAEEYSEKSEIVDQNINVLYFPAEVTVNFYDSEHQAVSYALVEDEIRVECGAESNPESKLELFEGEYVEPVVVLATEAAVVVVTAEEEASEEILDDTVILETVETEEETSPEYYDYDMEDNQELIEAVNQNTTISRKRRHQDEEHEEQDEEEITVDEAVETIENLISEIVPEASNETVAVEQVAIAAETVEATQASVLSSTLAALLQIAEPAYAPPHKIYSAAAENAEQTYQCRATAFDENFSSFSKLSAVSSIPTIYVNTPVLSISSENKNIDLLKPSVGDKIALSCGFAEGQNIGNVADFTVEYTFYQDGNLIASGSQNTEIVINKESAGDYSCAVSIPEIQRLQPQTSTNLISLDVASACVFNPEIKQNITPKSKTRQGQIINTFTCNIIGDNCKVFWIYDKEHFGKGTEIRSKKQIVFTDMPAATEESGSISCYAKNEEGLSRRATLNSKFIKASEPESNSSMYLLGAVVVLAVVLFVYKKKGKKDQQKGEQVSLNSA